MKIQCIPIATPCLTDYGCIGIDPGTVNLGVAFLLSECRSIVYQITLERFKSPVERIILAYDTMKNLLAQEMLHIPQDCRCIIEGAAYGDQFRQPELAEQRAAMVLALRPMPTKILSPLSIRKIVFGSAKILAKDSYSDLPKDAAVALSCAIAAERTDW